MLGKDAIVKLISDFDFETVLDIGSGAGMHSEVFKRYGKHVTALDLGGSAYYVDRVADAQVIGEYLDVDFERPFDCIWASHVLEHQRNIGSFLEKIFADLRPGGILAITVPPRKPQVVGGHVSIWNAGLLLYNLILAGFDCGEARVKQYDYNITVIVQKQAADLEALELTSDIGDIEKLACYFPFDARQDFDGDIFELNWDAPVVDRMATAPPASTPSHSATSAAAAEEMRDAAIRALTSLSVDERTPGLTPR